MCYSKRLEEYQLRHILGPDVLQLNEDQFIVHELMNKIKKKTGMRFKNVSMSVCLLRRLLRFFAIVVVVVFSALSGKKRFMRRKKMKILIFLKKDREKK